MKRSPIRRVLELIAGYAGDDPDLLAELVQAIRPRQRDADAAEGFKALLALLETDVVLRTGLALYVERLLEGRRMSRALTDPGMPSESFWYELRQRLVHKVLPLQPERESIEHVLVNVFFRESDADWVAAIDPLDRVRLLDLLGGRGLDQLPIDGAVMRDLLFALKVLGMRIAGRAFDRQVLRMVPEYENLESPFVALEDELDRYVAGLSAGTTSRSSDDHTHRHVRVLMGQCRDFIAKAYRNTAVYGIGFKVNLHLMVMERMLDRMSTLLDLVVCHEEVDGRLTTIDLVEQLIRFNSGRTQVLGLLDRSTQALSREITQHTGRTGELYITSTPSEYGRMLRTALGGGFIVAFACVFKAWYGTFDTSPLGHAFLYSLNYALAFTGIYLLHWTLATKQPAMTAATLATALDKGRDQPEGERYEAVAVLVARVWRSQFIAFVGNVAMAFPVALLLGMGWSWLFGPELFASRSAKLIHELDPVRSLALPHAAIAGVFLFISGLIAGSAANRTIHHRVPQRIQEHPVLKLVMRPEWRERIATYYANNYGGIISNVWFGVFMGSVGVLGGVVGLPLDIRHITFAAGNLALGLVGNRFQTPVGMLLLAILGVGLIGLMNFSVSFGLSMLLALRSRNIPWTATRPILRAVRAHFRRHPASFFFPPRTRTAATVSLPLEEAAEAETRTGTQDHTGS